MTTGISRRGALRLGALALPLVHVGSGYAARSRNFVDTMDVRSFLSVKQYGAVGNGSTDDTTAIQNALNAASAAGGGVVVLPPATYRYANSTYLSVPAGVTLFGYGATLSPLNPNNYSAIFLNGDRSNVLGVKIVSAATVRSAAGACMGIYLNGSTNSIVRDCTIQGVASASIYVQNATMGAFIENNIVDSGLSDAIHCTGGSNRIKIIGNRIYNAGDDYIAIISYAEDTQGPCHDIQVIGNYCEGAVWAQGIHVEGNNVVVANNICRNTNMSGIYIATEVNRNFANIDVIGNYVEHCNVSGNHPSDITIYAAGGFTVTNVNIVGNTLYNSTVSGMCFLYSGTANSIVNLNVANNTINTTAQYGIHALASACSGLNIAGNTIRNIAYNGICVDAGNLYTGITHNVLTNVQTSGSTSGDARGGIYNAAAGAIVSGNNVSGASIAANEGYYLAGSTANTIELGNNYNGKGHTLNSQTPVGTATNIL